EIQRLHSISNAVNLMWIHAIHVLPFSADEVISLSIPVMLIEKRVQCRPMLVIYPYLRVEVDFVTQLLHSPVVVNIFTTKEFFIELPDRLNDLSFVRD